MAMTNSTKKKLLILSIVIISLASLGYWIYSLFIVSTDDAYLNANIVQVASRVSGQVSHLYVRNNQHVQQGQSLYSLDREPYLIAINRADAYLAASEAKASLAAIVADRTNSLVSKKVASIQQGDITKANLKAAQAAVELNKAQLAQAKLNLQYTTVTASTSGWVTNMVTRAGNNVAANQPIFSLISDHEFWLDANFKETEFTHIALGQKAEIVVDMYPNKTFIGQVESISGGTGNAFSLLPPENATGNWVKVTQRVPVRIQILDADPNYPLRIGTSATVTMHIKPWG
jgi:membrane fusion protein (multidrug efflux system)